MDGTPHPPLVKDVGRPSLHNDGQNDPRRSEADVSHPVHRANGAAASAPKPPAGGANAARRGHPLLGRSTPAATRSDRPSGPLRRRRLRSRSLRSRARRRRRLALPSTRTRPGLAPPLSPPPLNPPPLNPPPLSPPPLRRSRLPL